MKRMIAWLVHVFTALGALVGLLALWFIAQGEYILSFWCMGAAMFIDAIDGTLARRADVKRHLPNFDGALLDNVVDYFTYVLVPAFFILYSGVMPLPFTLIGAGGIVLASSFQFCQLDAKTDDKFFKGFPSLWNIVVFYIFICGLSYLANFAFLMLLIILVFVPVKYVYPSQMQYFSKHAWVRVGMLIATCAWGVATLGLILVYPSPSPILLLISLGYVVLYFAASFYRTLIPLK